MPVLQNLAKALGFRTSFEKSAAQSEANFKQKRVVVSMLKGGVGKSTITCFLATAVQKIWDDENQDGRVLVVDTDPQGSATDFFLHGEEIARESSLWVLLGPQPYVGGLQRLIRSTRYSRIDVLPAHTDVAKVQSNDEKMEARLTKFLDSKAKSYRLILIDTPPSETLALKNALLAAHDVLAPIDPSRQCLHTLLNFMKKLEELKQRNSSLEIVGVAVSRYDKKQKANQGVLETLKTVLALNSQIPVYEIPARAAITRSYNSFLGVCDALPSNDKQELKIFEDIAKDILSRGSEKEKAVQSL